MTDVLLRHGDNGGDIEAVLGRFTMSNGLETAAFLSMFGGNERDSGGDEGLPLEWWGNKSETVLARRYRSETQHLLRSLPAIPFNMRRIEDAAERDLAWFVETGLATFVGVVVSIPALNTVAIVMTTEVDGQVFEISFTQPWRQSTV